MSEENVDLDQEAVQEEEQVNVLNMSDEELANFDVSAYDEPEESEDDSQEEDANEDTEEEEEAESTEESEEEGETEEEETSEDESESESDEEEETPEDEESEEEEVDHKAMVDELLSPFKANGKEMKVDTIADARQLMQMGANYNKKMVGLKPHLRVVKMLENNGLLDEDKLNFLIDINNKSPEAISKLLKDSGIDPLEINVDNADEYKPKTYNASDTQVELDLVLEEIRESDGYQKTMNIVSTKWDDSSSKILVANPEIIKTINGHVEAGIYDKIETVMESERMMGRLTGKSDIEAYKEIGDRLFAAGAFNDAPKEEPAKTPVKKILKKAEGKKDTSSKKAAASITKAASSKAKPDDDFNPLSLSDEEFEKFAAKNFQ